MRREKQSRCDDRSKLGGSMDCDKCRKRSCRLSSNFWMRLFFSYGKSSPECEEFEPDYCRGIEGVWS